MGVFDLPQNPSRGSSGAHMMPVSTSIRLSKWLSEKFRLMSKVESAKRRKVKRGQVYWCEFGENIGSEQCQKRPALILQNDSANFSSPNTIVAPITNTADSNASVFPLNRPPGSPIQGHVLLGNVVTISKARLGDMICTLDAKTEMPGIESALHNAVGTAPGFEALKTKLADKEQFLERVKKDRNEAQDNLTSIKEALNLPDDAEIEAIFVEIEKLKN